MKALVGSLSYKLPVLPPSPSPPPTTTTATTLQSSIASSRKRSRPTTSLVLTGWVLNDTWMLSIPSSHRRLAATAVRCNRLVRIDSYRTICTSDPYLLEIDDLRLLPDDHTDDNDKSETTVTTKSTPQKTGLHSLWTLREIGRLERLDVETANIERRGGGRFNNKEKQCCDYSFRAVVVAISPIIVMDKNPFALMELCEHHDYYYHEEDMDDDMDSSWSYQKSSSSSCCCCCCLVVIRDHGLLYTESVKVGDFIQLLQVRRQKWRIPTICPTAPSAVFVLQDVAQLIWLDRSSSSSLSQSHRPRIINNNNNNLSGTIRSVHWLTTKNNTTTTTTTTTTSTTKQLHFLEVSCKMNNNDNDGVWWIFVTYFPMSVALQCSLRPGAQIVAYRLHRIAGTTALAANLQSQLLVVHFAPTTTIPIPNDKLLSSSSSSSSSCLLLDELTPYAWHRRIRQSYTHLFWKRQLANILSSFRQDAFVASNASSLPSIDTLLMPFLDPSNSPPPARNAYAEFFFDNVPPSSSSSSSTDMTAPPMGWRKCDALANIRAMAMTQLLDRLLQKNKQGATAVQVGWNASFRVELNIDDNTVMYTLGQWTTHAKEGIRYGSLSDGHSETPIVVLQHEPLEYLPENPLFAWVEIQAVYMSCICISDAVGLFGEPSIKNLPYHSSNKNVHGGASLVLIDGHLYVTSILIAAQAIKYVGRHSMMIPKHRSLTSTKQYVRVEECLRLLDLPPRPIQGMLVRTWWTPTKLKSSIFHGLEVTVGHAFAAEDDEGVTNPNDAIMISLLQSINFKPKVEIHNLEDFVGIVKAITEGCDIPSAHLILGAVWWKLADDVSLCSLLMGGWDDGQVAMDATVEPAVMIAIPSSCLMRDPKRGLVRFRCSIDDLVVSLRKSSYAKTPTNVGSIALFDFESRSKKVVVGMLNRRTKRIGPFQEAAVLLSPTNISGVTSQSISRVFLDLLDDLRTQSRQHMRPSLVRAIPNATFLGVSYCRAVAYCSKCYQELKLPPSKKTSVRNGKDRYTTTLECPNDCDVRLYGSVKWECSGILDDSTGQAKLYSEREASVFLLTGMSAKHRNWIEQGVWSGREGGIVFSKTMPPKSSLQYAVKSARMAAAHSSLSWKQTQGPATTTTTSTGNNHPRRRTSRIIVTEDDVLDHMSPMARAEYLMEWTCRSPPCRMNHHHHRLYFVRCKPLSDTVVHVGQTDVQLANRQNGIFTYTLPPLQLTLVDCAVLV